MRSAGLRVSVALSLTAAGCVVSKSTYFKKVDEAAKARHEAEACAKSMRLGASFRAELEGRIATLEKRVAIGAIERDKCRSDLASVQAKLDSDGSALRESLRKAHDEVNELKTKLALADEQVRGSRAEVERIRADAQKRVAELKRPPDLTDVVEALKGVADDPALGAAVEPLRGAVRLRIPERALFPRRTRVLVHRRGRQLLGRLAEAIKKLPTRAVIVQGHQDGAPVPGRLRTPLELSLAQANAVALSLLRAGVEPDRLSVAALGATRSLEQAPGAEPYPKSRRIEIVFQPAGALEPSDGGGRGTPSPRL
jgi:chemotaxis protein MotB